MKKNLLLAVLINLLSFQIKSQCTFGNFPPSFTVNAGWTNGIWIAKKFTLPATATLTGLGLNAAIAPGSTTPFRMAIYTDASNMPGNFVSATNQATMTTGQNPLSVPVPTVIAAGNYWIVAIYGNSSVPTSYNPSGSNPCFYQTGSLSTPPANLSAWTTGGNYDIDYWAIINTPSVTINGPVAICIGSSVSFTASGANTYTWSTGPLSNTITSAPNTNTTYSVAATNALGCIGSSSVSLIVNPLPTLIIAGNTTLCTGSSLSQTVAGATSYTWSNGATTNTVLVSPLTNTVYTVTGTTTNGCVKTLTLPITVMSLPLVSISGSSVVCIGSSITSTVSGASSYTWNTGATTNTILISPATNTLYSATGTGTNGCVTSATLPITVVQLPLISISGGSIVCSGSNLSQTVSGATSYSWSTGAISNTVLLSPTTNTVYSVIGTDANGCMSATSKSITVNALPTLTVSLLKTAICAGESNTVSAAGALTYVWNSGETTFSLSITPTLTTSYTVTGTDVNGCENSVTVSQIVSQCTGLSKLQENKIVVSVFPNPGNGIFELKLNDLNETTSVQIFNYNGMLLKNESLNSENTTLDLSVYSNGLYYVVVRSNTHQSVIKLIKE